MNHNYAKPPITEAVVDVRFASPISDGDVEKVQRKLTPDYPNLEILQNLDVLVNVDASGAKASVEPHTTVKKLTSADQTQIALLSATAITVSQLAPYTGWEAFFARFKRDWNSWRSVAGYNKIQRIGVRYINRIDIPVSGDAINLADYIKFFVEIPDELGRMNQYAGQAMVELPSKKCNLTLNTASIPSPLIDHLSFIVDLDLSTQADLPQKDDDLFDLLDAIRKEKNAAFESCLTEKTRELFDK